MDVMLVSQHRAPAMLDSDPASYSEQSGCAGHRRPGEHRHPVNWCPEEDSNLHALASAST